MGLRRTQAIATTIMRPLIRGPQTFRGMGWMRIVVAVMRRCRPATRIRTKMGLRRTQAIATTIMRPLIRGPQTFRGMGWMRIVVAVMRRCQGLIVSMTARMRILVTRFVRPEPEMVSVRSEQLSKKPMPKRVSRPLSSTPGTYNVNLSGPNDDIAVTGDLDITDNLIIESSNGDPATVIISGNGLDRVFDLPKAARTSPFVESPFRVGISSARRGAGFGMSGERSRWRIVWSRVINQTGVAEGSAI